MRQLKKICRGADEVLLISGSTFAIARSVEVSTPSRGSKSEAGCIKRSAEAGPKCPAEMMTV